MTPWLANMSNASQNTHRKTPQRNPPKTRSLTPCTQCCNYPRSVLVLSCPAAFANTPRLDTFSFRRRRVSAADRQPLELPPFTGDVDLCFVLSPCHVCVTILLLRPGERRGQRGRPGFTSCDSHRCVDGIRRNRLTMPGNSRLPLPRSAASQGVLTHASISTNLAIPTSGSSSLGDSVSAWSSATASGSAIPRGRPDQAQNPRSSRGTPAPRSPTDWGSPSDGKGMRLGLVLSRLAAGVLEWIHPCHFPRWFEACVHGSLHRPATAATTHQQSYKSRLQQHAQQALAGTPMYEVVDEKGPLIRVLRCGVVLGTQTFGTAGT